MTPAARASYKDPADKNLSFSVRLPRRTVKLLDIALFGNVRANA